MLLNDSDFEILERRYAMHLIMAVGQNPGCTKIDAIMLNSSMYQKTKFVRIGELIDAGLIEYVKVEGKTTSRLRLTPLGEELYVKVKAIRSILRKCKDSPEEGE